MDSLCVPKPEIEEVMLLETGQILSAQDAIGTDYGHAEELRMRLAEENSAGTHSHICPICRVGVYLCVYRTQQWGKRFYFKHRVENGNCPAITRGNLSKGEIDARKYNGVKESQAHIRMKEIIAESLSQDARFSGIEIEPVWKGDGGNWRKPDVRAIMDGNIKVVFEIQLSTTFLHVIAERRRFYRQHGALLCWIFKSFDPADALMTQDDIFYNNNRNLFLVSEQTLDYSKKNKSLTLDCHWHEPRMDHGITNDYWNGQYLNFSQLHMDFDHQRVYFFDYDQSLNELKENALIGDLRRRFEDWWSHNQFPEADKTWGGFREDFQRYGIQLPQHPLELNGLLKALYSAKAGKTVGWLHPKLISVAHTVHGSHPHALQPFLAALSVYGRKAQIKQEDSPKPGEKMGKLEAKLATCRSAKANGDTSFNRNRAYDPLIAFLFPEVLDKLQVWDASAGQ